MKKTFQSELKLQKATMYFPLILCFAIICTNIAAKPTTLVEENSTPITTTVLEEDVKNVSAQSASPEPTKDLPPSTIFSEAESRDGSTAIIQTTTPLVVTADEIISTTGISEMVPTDSSPPKRITTEPTTPGEYGSIYCDYFPDPLIEDLDNYGDGECTLIGSDREGDLLLFKIVTSNDGDTFFSDHYGFPGVVVTRVRLLNFGRHHGAVNAIDIFNERGVGSVDVYVDIFKKKGIRMFLEIYGFRYYK